MSQSSRQVTHVLLTRSRLCPRPKPGSSLHLHVLSMPPAFVLSQDQTLRKRLAWIFSGTSNGCRLHKSRESCHIRTDGRHSYTCANPGLTGSTQTAAPQMWDRRVEPGRDQSSPRLGLGDRTLLSFQRPWRSSGAGSPPRCCALLPSLEGERKGLPKEARRQCSGAVALLAAAGLPGGLFKGHLRGS